MSEPFVGSEMSEELEGTEALTREMQELNEITNEPESYIEIKIDVVQSEAIESGFNELVNNRSSGGEIEIPALDGSSKLRYDLAGGVEVDEVECDPIPLPMPFDVDVNSSPPEGAADETSIDPTPLFRENQQVVAVYDGSSFQLQSGVDENPDPIFTSPDLTPDND